MDGELPRVSEQNTPEMADVSYAAHLVRKASAPGKDSSCLDTVLMNTPPLSLALASHFYYGLGHRDSPIQTAHELAVGRGAERCLAVTLITLLRNRSNHLGLSVMT